MSMKEETKVSKLVKFSGDKKDWLIWSEKFLARARRIDYKDILLGNENVPYDSVQVESLGEEEKKKTIKLRKLNEEAF